MDLQIGFIDPFSSLFFTHIIYSTPSSKFQSQTQELHFWLRSQVATLSRCDPMLWSQCYLFSLSPDHGSSSTWDYGTQAVTLNYVTGLSAMPIAWIFSFLLLSQPGPILDVIRRISSQPYVPGGTSAMHQARSEFSPSLAHAHLTIVLLTRRSKWSLNLGGNLLTSGGYVNYISMLLSIASLCLPSKY